MTLLGVGTLSGFGLWPSHEWIGFESLPLPTSTISELVFMKQGVLLLKGASAFPSAERSSVSPKVYQSESAEIGLAQSYWLCFCFCMTAGMLLPLDERDRLFGSRTQITSPLCQIQNGARHSWVDKQKCWAWVQIYNIALMTSSQEKLGHIRKNNPIYVATIEGNRPCKRIPAGYKTRSSASHPWSGLCLTACNILLHWPFKHLLCITSIPWGFCESCLQWLMWLQCRC